MRVLVTADTVGGVFTYATELASALAARGVEVAVATTGRLPSADQRADLHRAGVGVLFESAWRLEWMEDPWDDVARTSEWLLDACARFRPDVVHLDDYAHGALPFGVPVVVVAHSCVCSWFEAVRRTAPPPSFDRYRAEVRRGLSHADVVVAPTRAMLSALQRHHGPLSRTRVIPNARDPSRFRAADPKDAVILCAARLWDEAKNAAALDRLAPELPWPVLLAGEEQHPDAAHGGARRRGGARALGRLAPDALARELARAAVYALPARYEPFGLSALEAAHSGCALVLGDLESLRETWEGAALFVDPDDERALRDALLRLCRDEELRRRMAAAALASARRLTPARMATEYLETYAAAQRRHGRKDGLPCAS